MDEEAEVTTSQEAGAEATEEGKAPSLIFGKFKDISEAEKSYREAEKKISLQGQELAVRQARLQDLEEKTNLAKMIETVAASKRQESQPTGKSLEEMISEIGNDLSANPAEGTKKLIDLQAAWLRDSEKRVTTHSDERVGALEGMLKTVLDKIDRIDPAYQKDKDVIDRLVKDYGMSLSAARKLAADMDQPDAPVQRSRPPMTPSTSGKPGPGMPVFITAKEKAEMKADGLDDADITALENEYRENYQKELAEKKARE